MATFFEPLPTLEISILNGGFFEVDKLKFPSLSVTVPALSPLTLTLAPEIGSFLLSFTEPDIEVCAKVMPQKNNETINK